MSLAPDLDRIRIKSDPVKIDRLTRRVFVTPWDSTRIYIVSDTTAQSGGFFRLLSIPRPEKRFRVSIGSVFGGAVDSIALPTGVPQIRMTLLDGRQTSGATPILTPSNVLFQWRDHLNDAALSGGGGFAPKIYLTFFPDGILLPKDVRPILHCITTCPAQIFFGCVYRYEEWS